MSEFLLMGPNDPDPTPPPVLTGIRFISIASGGIELIGEVVQVVNSLAVVKDPFIVGRDVRNVSKFNIIKLSKANPVTTSPIYIPVSSIVFTCVPNDQFLKNYLTARSGLVSAPAMAFDDNGSGLP